MISSTGADLPEHRKHVVEACLREGIFPIGMEQLPSRDATGIQVSLEMVYQADIYIGIYAWRYGWVPDFDNPEQISVTEMEFDRALERKQRGNLKEILIFVMHDDHPTTRRDVEADAIAQEKLKKFLTDWVTTNKQVPADTRIFNLVAIGGMGKSAFTWKWFNDIAPNELRSSPGACGGASTKATRTTKTSSRPGGLCALAARVTGGNASTASHERVLASCAKIDTVGYIGVCACCIPIKRLAKCAVILKPSSLTRLHHDYQLAAVAD